MSDLGHDPTNDITLSDFESEIKAGICTYPRCPCQHIESVAHYCVAKIYAKRTTDKDAK